MAVRLSWGAFLVLAAVVSVMTGDVAWDLGRRSAAFALSAPFSDNSFDGAIMMVAGSTWEGASDSDRADSQRSHQPSLFVGCRDSSVVFYFEC